MLLGDVTRERRVVRRLFEAMERGFESYWREPGSDRRSDGGRDYRPRLDDVEDLDGDQVYAVVGLRGQSKDGGGTMDARF